MHLVARHKAQRRPRAMQADECRAHDALFNAKQTRQVAVISRADGRWRCHIHSQLLAYGRTCIKHENMDTSTQLTIYGERNCCGFVGDCW